MRMTFFRNCARDRDLASDWRSVVGDDDAAPVYVDETAPEAIEKVMRQTVIKVTSDNPSLNVLKNKTFREL